MARRPHRFEPAAAHGNLLAALKHEIRLMRLIWAPDVAQRMIHPGLKLRRDAGVQHCLSEERNAILTSHTRQVLDFIAMHDKPGAAQLEDLPGPSNVIRM